MISRLVVCLVTALVLLLASCVSPTSSRDLRLTGLAGKVIRGELPATDETPHY